MRHSDPVRLLLPYGLPLVALGLLVLLGSGTPRAFGDAPAPPATNNIITGGFGWLDKKYRKPSGTYETAVVLLAVCATADPAKKTDLTEAARNAIRERLAPDKRKWGQELVDSLVRKHEGPKRL